jgi:hypothetical protein
VSAVLVQATAVVVATNFNPTVFNQVWLTTNKVIPPQSGDPLPDSVFTDVVVQAQAPDFTLVVTPQQLHFIPRATDADGQRAEETLGRIVKLLPETPYTASGLNFAWHSEPMPEIGRVARKLFVSDRPPFNRFNSEDARFGTYASKNVGIARLRLDVRPIRALAEPGVERMQFLFNFERDVKSDPDKPASIIELASKWDEYKELAEAIVSETLEASSR